ncbi:hypothetical protein AB9M62_25290 [Bacillales bacterium AN1005]
MNWGIISQITALFSLVTVLVAMLGNNSIRPYLITFGLIWIIFLVSWYMINRIKIRRDSNKNNKSARKIDQYEKI